MSGSLGCLLMRALILTVAVALLLYGTSLFSRDRESPSWTQAANSSWRPVEEPARFESLTALVRSVDDLSTGSLEIRDGPALPPVTGREEELVLSGAAPRPAVQKRLTSKRTNVAKSNSAKSQGQPLPRAVKAVPPSATEPSKAGTQPIEFTLADRGN